MLHKFPHEVDEMPWEDVQGLIAYAEIEREELDAKKPNTPAHAPAPMKSGRAKTTTHTTVYRPRPKEGARHGGRA